LFMPGGIEVGEVSSVARPSANVPIGKAADVEEELGKGLIEHAEASNAKAGRPSTSLAQDRINPPQSWTVHSTVARGILTSRCASV
jgi:hypothetical protein